MDGKEIRASIDTENVKGLLLTNGGGAVALLAFLPSVLNNPDYKPLTFAILVALLFFQLGLVSALLHNHLRRRCSLAYDSSKPKYKFLGLGLPEPTVCHWSHLFMYGSYGCFVLAGILVFIGGIKVLCFS